MKYSPMHTTATGGVWRVNDTISMLEYGRTHAYMQVSITPKKQEDVGADNFCQTFYYEKETRNYSV